MHGGRSAPTQATDCGTSPRSAAGAQGDDMDHDIELCRCVVETPIGPLTLVATPHALREVRFPSAAPPGPAAGPGRPGQPVLVQAARELGEYFAGSRRSFDVPLDPR